MSEERITELRPEHKRAAIHLAHGGSMAEAAKIALIGKESTIEEWLETWPAFQRAFAASYRAWIRVCSSQAWAKLFEIGMNGKTERNQVLALNVLHKSALSMDKIEADAQKRVPGGQKLSTDLSQIGFKGSAVPPVPPAGVKPDPRGLSDLTAEDAAEDEGEDNNE